MLTSTGYRLVSALLLFTALCDSAIAQIEGFTESFTGTGDYQSVGGTYDGLDNPGWAIGGTRGSEWELTDDGIEFVSDSESVGGLVVQQEIRKRVVGQSGFAEEIRLKNLSLAEVTEENQFGVGSVISLNHFFSVGNLFSRVSVGLSDPTEPDGVWQLFLSAPAVQGERPFQSVLSLVPRSDDLILRLTYNQQSSTISASYEPNVFDNEPPTELVLPLDVDLSADNETRFISAAEGTQATGILNSWSLMPISDITGDFNGNGNLDANDIDLLSVEVRNGGNPVAFDLNLDSVVDRNDTETWVHDLKNTYFGDANLDGEFSSVDLVFVLAAGQYEDELLANSGWASGDWDGDTEFTSADLVAALADGGYEAGPRAAVAFVPEPSTCQLVLAAFATFFSRRRKCHIHRRRSNEKCRLHSSHYGMIPR